MRHVGKIDGLQLQVSKISSNGPPSWTKKEWNESMGWTVDVRF